MEVKDSNSYEEYLKKARDTYDILVKRNKGRLTDLSETHWNYSTMLRKHGKYKEEIEQLNLCFEKDRAAENRIASAAAESAQDRLMEIATMTSRDRLENDEKTDSKARVLSYVEALETKFRIFSSREDFKTARFYMESAMKQSEKESDKGRHTSQKENLIGMLIGEGSKAVKTKEHRFMLLNDADKLIQELPNKARKEELTIAAQKGKIELLMGHKKLKALKASASHFEETLEKSMGGDELKQASYNVFQESKSTLDHSMHHLRKKVFPGASEKIYFPYLPTTKEKLEKKFEEFKFQGISQKFPQIIDFVLKKNQLPWVKEFIEIRNTKVFIHNQIIISLT